VDQRPAPAEIDRSVPNGARIYDYMLGGKDHFQADETAAERMIAANPAAPLTARANRAFLGRAVRFLAKDAGIRQFLDLGTGLPTQQNVHEVAQGVAPDARVVYVDYDPVVVLHGRALLATTGTVTVVQGDLRRPNEILAHPQTRRLIDFDQPVAVLLVAILHFITDEEDPAGIVARLRDEMAPGSHLVISHTANESPDEVMAAAQQGFRMAGAPLTPRTRAEVARFFDGFDMLDPGLVEVSQWRPDTPEAPPPSGSPWTIVGGVGRKSSPGR
jgi:hypothetical protein